MTRLSPSRTFKALLSCALLAFGALAHAQTVFRVTTIPEEAATEQTRKFGPIAAYLEKKLGMKVEFTPVSDYPAAVEVMVNKKDDLVWFGGFTFVQAQIRSGGKIIPLAQREGDRLIIENLQSCGEEVWRSPVSPYGPAGFWRPTLAGSR